MTDRLPGIVQFLPLSLFAAYAFRHGMPTDDRWVEAFELGAVAAVLQLLLVLRRARPVDRLVLAANLYLIAGGLAGFARQWWVLRLYGTLAESGIFLFVFAVGAVATFTTPTGFLTVEGTRPAQIRRSSLWMLAATLAAFGVSVLFRGDRSVAAVLPIVGLMVAQRMLAARINGRVPIASGSES